MSYATMTPAELALRLKRGDRLSLIDVRETDEHALAHVPEAQLLPLSRFQEWVETLDPDEELVVMCHHGIRSAQVCAYLSQQGFRKLHNLAGGIERWSLEVDANVPRY
jgi:rhodanese-related sulfurtransferase